ncbi:MAG: phage tail protein [Candidatus Binataceae bacterium]|nr:phage tail protein [Candidatus Binataceae bacterium]
MFAIFGDIPFEVLGSPEQMAATNIYGYAEHQVVEDQPRLQWVGDALTVIELELMFHVSFTSPALQLAALELAASDHQARALVFGSGEYVGYFVVTRLTVISRSLGPTGLPIAILARLELKQWAINTGLSASSPLAPLITPIAIAVASSSSNTASNNSPAIPAVSAMLITPAPSGPGSSQMTPGDVPTTRIVRSAGA